MKPGAVDQRSRAQTPRFFSPADVDQMVAGLTARARALMDDGERRLLGITGPPGSGKSTVCDALQSALGPAVAIVGMDGFHLSNEELERMGRRDRKGAPDTFDVSGYLALLRRLRRENQNTVYAPRFDRSIEQSIGSAVPIEPRTSLIITEGNYLLHQDGGWQHVREALDEVWYLDVPETVLTDRLVERQVRHGKSPAEARMWTESVDLPNATAVAAERDRADLVVVGASRT